jgi:hypothetical protein
VGVSNAMIGGEPIQMGSCSVILRNVMTGMVHEPKGLLGLTIPLTALRPLIISLIRKMDAPLPRQ